MRNRGISWKGESWVAVPNSSCKTMGFTEREHNDSSQIVSSYVSKVSHVKLTFNT